MHAARVEFLVEKNRPSHERSKPESTRRGHTQQDRDGWGSLPEGSEGNPYGRYVTYKGQVYELGATEPKLMEITDEYDEMELGLTKGTWVKRFGLKPE